MIIIITGRANIVYWNSPNGALPVRFVARKTRERGGGKNLYTSRIQHRKTARKKITTTGVVERMEILDYTTVLCARQFVKIRWLRCISAKVFPGTERGARARKPPVQLVYAPDERTSFTHTQHTSSPLAHHSHSNPAKTRDATPRCDTNTRKLIIVFYFSDASYSFTCEKKKTKKNKIK